MPPSFPVCRTCWLEVPGNLKIEYWDATGHKDQDRTQAATKAILSHLKQYGTAIPLP